MPKRKISYTCVKCGAETSADEDTERGRQRLCRDCFGRRADRRVNRLNDLTGAEWAKHSKSVEQYPDVRTESQRVHGAAFPKSLAKHHIEAYTKAGDTVLDPFAGVGTTLLAAQELGRRSIGVEINPAFAELCRNDVLPRAPLAALYEGDALVRLRDIPPGSVDMVLTSPPYANLLRTVKGDFAYKWRELSAIDPISNPRPYSELENDVGNMNYDDGVAALAQAMRLCFAAQRDEGYAVWVVKDFRDLKRRVPYINFHGDIIQCAAQAGYRLWDIRIYDQTAYRPLVCLGYPSRNLYLNIGHSYILIFKK